MGSGGLGVQVTSIQKNSKGEEDLGDDLEVINADAEPLQDDDISQE